MLLLWLFGGKKLGLFGYEISRIKLAIHISQLVAMVAERNTTTEKNATSS
jgi:hypothetical protein